MGDTPYYPYDPAGRNPYPEQEGYYYDPELGAYVPLTDTTQEPYYAGGAQPAVYSPYAPAAPAYGVPLPEQPAAPVIEPPKHYDVPDYDKLFQSARPRPTRRRHEEAPGQVPAAAPAAPETIPPAPAAPAVAPTFAQESYRVPVPAPGTAPLYTAPSVSHVRRRAYPEPAPAVSAPAPLPAFSAEPAPAAVPAPQPAAPPRRTPVVSQGLFDTVPAHVPSPVQAPAPAFAAEPVPAPAAAPAPAARPAAPVVVEMRNNTIFPAVEAPAPVAAAAPAPKPVAAPVVVEVKKVRRGDVLEPVILPVDQPAPSAPQPSPAVREASAAPAAAAPVRNEPDTAPAVAPAANAPEAPLYAKDTIPAASAAPAAPVVPVAPVAPVAPAAPAAPATPAVSVMPAAPTVEVYRADAAQAFAEPAAPVLNEPDTAPAVLPEAEAPEAPVYPENAVPATPTMPAAEAPAAPAVDVYRADAAPAFAEPAAPVLNEPDTATAVLPEAEAPEAAVYTENAAPAAPAMPAAEAPVIAAPAAAAAQASEEDLSALVEEFLALNLPQEEAPASQAASVVPSAPAAETAAELPQQAPAAEPIVAVPVQPQAAQSAPAEEAPVLVKTHEDVPAPAQEPSSPLFGIDYDAPMDAPVQPVDIEPAAPLAAILPAEPEPAAAELPAAEGAQPVPAPAPAVKTHADDTASETVTFPEQESAPAAAASDTSTFDFGAQEKSDAFETIRFDTANEAGSTRIFDLPAESAAAAADEAPLFAGFGAGEAASETPAAAAAAPEVTAPAQEAPTLENAATAAAAEAPVFTGFGDDTAPAFADFGAGENAAPAFADFGAGENAAPAFADFGAADSDAPLFTGFGAQETAAEAPAAEVPAPAQETPAAEAAAPVADEVPFFAGFGEDTAPAFADFGANDSDAPLFAGFGAQEAASETSEALPFAQAAPATAASPAAADENAPAAPLSADEAPLFAGFGEDTAPAFADFGAADSDAPLFAGFGAQETAPEAPAAAAPAPAQETSNHDKAASAAEETPVFTGFGDDTAPAFADFGAADSDAPLFAGFGTEESAPETIAPAQETPAFEKAAAATAEAPSFGLFADADMQPVSFGADAAAAPAAFGDFGAAEAAVHAENGIQPQFGAFGADNQPQPARGGFGDFDAEPAAFAAPAAAQSEAVPAFGAFGAFDTPQDDASAATAPAPAFGAFDSLAADAAPQADAGLSGNLFDTAFIPPTGGASDINNIADNLGQAMLAKSYNQAFTDNNLFADSGKEGLTVHSVNSDYYVSENGAKPGQMFADIHFSLHAGDCLAVVSDIPLAAYALARTIAESFDDGDESVSLAAAEDGSERELLYIGSDAMIPEDMTCTEFLLYSLSAVYGEEPGEREERVRVALTQVGLGDLEDEPIADLSHNKRLLILALSAALNPNIGALVLNDKAFDIEGVEESIALRVFALLNTNGKCTVLASCSSYLMATVANRVLVIRQGRIAFDGSYRKFLDTNCLGILSFTAPDPSKAIAQLPAQFPNLSVLSKGNLVYLVRKNDGDIDIEALLKAVSACGADYNSVVLDDKSFDIALKEVLSL